MIAIPFNPLLVSISEFSRIYKNEMEVVSLTEIQKACEDCYLVKPPQIDEFSEAQIEAIARLIDENISKNYRDILFSGDQESFARYILVLLAVPLAYIQSPLDFQRAFKKISNKLTLDVGISTDLKLFFDMALVGFEDELWVNVQLLSYVPQFQPAYKEIKDATFCLARFALVNKFGEFTTMFPNQGTFHLKFFEMLASFANHEVSYHRDIQLILTQKNHPKPK